MLDELLRDFLPTKIITGLLIDHNKFNLAHMLIYMNNMIIHLCHQPVIHQQHTGITLLP